MSVPKYWEKVTICKDCGQKYQWNNGVDPLFGKVGKDHKEECKGDKVVLGKILAKLEELERKIEELTRKTCK